MIDAQSEDLWRVAGLDAVALALTGVAGDDSEVRTSDSEDGTAVVGAGVERALLGVGEDPSGIVVEARWIYSGCSGRVGR